MRSVIVRILAVCIGLTLWTSLFQSVVAHPLDVSSTTLTIRVGSVSGTTFLHPAEVERILGLRGIAIRSITYVDYYRHEDFIFDYLRTRVDVRSGSGTCEIGHFATRERGVDEIFSEGFPVSYDFSCSSPIKDFLDVRISIFADLPLQTNRVKVYDAVGNPLGYKVLTSSIVSHVFVLDGTAEHATDSDGDGLSDEEERAYRTDSHRPDSDGDNYSDAEEVNNGWNPFSASLSPGQKYREQPLPSVDTGSIDAGQDEISRRYVHDTGLLDASGYGGEYLKQTLSAIVAFVGNDNPGAFASLFGLIVLLGFIHAAWPGHSKSLLVGFVLDRRNGWRRGMAFALIFTVTHLADIALLVLVTKYLFSVYDPALYMTWLQRGWSLLLVGFAIVIIVRAFQRLRRQTIIFPVCGETEGVSVQESPFAPSNILLGFFAGLAPCTFGWSIFLVLFSLGRMEWALPLLGALGIGIFLCLSSVVLVTIVARNRFLSRIPRFAIYSEVVSAVSIGLVAGMVTIAVF